MKLQKRQSQNEKPLVMRLIINDCIRAQIDGEIVTLRVLKMSNDITFVKHNETNIPARYAAKLKAQKDKKEEREYDTQAYNDHFFQKAISADALRKYHARRVTISPIGELRDPGFKE